MLETVLTNLVLLLAIAQTYYCESHLSKKLSTYLTDYSINLVFRNLFGTDKSVKKTRVESRKGHRKTLLFT